MKAGEYRQRLIARGANALARLIYRKRRIKHRRGNSVTRRAFALLRQHDHEQLALWQLSICDNIKASKTVEARVKFLPRPRQRALQTGINGTA